MNLSQFETAVAAEIGMDTTNEKTVIDTAINRAVQRVLEDTHCYVKQTDFSGFDGTSSNFTLDSGILDIEDLFFTSGTTKYTLERTSLEDLNDRRRAGTPTGTPAQFFAVAGWNLLAFYPTPASGDTLTVYHIPIPTALSASTDDPSTNANGGVPEVLHEAIFFYACSRLASGDDDQSSAQGQRYRDWYKEEITRYRGIIRKRGGRRMGRARVGFKGHPRVFHTNDIYPVR